MLKILLILIQMMLTCCIFSLMLITTILVGDKIYIHIASKLMDYASASKKNKNKFREEILLELIE